MSSQTPGAPEARLPGKPVLVGVYALYAAVVLRTLAIPDLHSLLPIYLGLEAVFLVLFSLLLWRPPQQALWRHLYLIIQSILILVLLALRPQFDLLIILFILLSLQAVLLFDGRTRWIWVGILVLTMGVSSIAGLGLLKGLSLALMPMTIAIVFPAYVSINQEIENHLRHNQALLAELQETNRQLQQSIHEAEELSAIQERMRLARELHDSVSQTLFGISLQTRSAQLLLQREPERLEEQLERLQAITHGALEEMRSLIAQLRPPEASSTTRPTP
jgi:signal transduction histidine kinase